MLKHSRFLSPESITAQDYARDLAAAAAAGADPLHQKDIAVLTEGFFQNLASVIIDYNILLSGGDANTYILAARNTLEKIADDVEEEALIANNLPATAADIPHDKQGLGSLLLLPKNDAKVARLFPNKGDFSVDKVWNLLFSAAPKGEAESTYPVQSPEELAKMEEGLASGEIKPHVEDMSEGLNKPAAWTFIKAAADESAVVEQARQMMVDSGYFSEEQRSDAFNQKLNDILMQTKANIDDEVAARAAARAGRAELAEQKQAEGEAEDLRVKEIAEGDLANLSPETRKKLEDAQAERAKAIAEETNKQEMVKDRKKEFSGTPGIPTPAVPGLDNFVDKMRRVMVPEDKTLEGQQLNVSMNAYLSELQKAIASDPDNWRGPAADLIQNYPDLMERAEVVDILSQQQNEAREEKREYKPPMGPGKDIPVSQRSSLNVAAGLIKKHEEYDKTRGPWELDIEAKALRRRKVMVANSMMGRPPVPYTLGDTVGFSRGSEITSGKILAIAASTYIVETLKGVTKVAHEEVFEPSATNLF
ncbi:MAG TPA: hypothetical protein P5248_08560 [Bacteroidales bacterium]|nr:hypothetical protein [Bacteroidales bacterium]